MRLIAVLGRPRTVTIVLAIVMGWALANLVLLASGHRAFDPPPFQALQGLLSMTALLMTILILVAENRMSEVAEQRARLNLQISLLAERKAAKTIQLLEELRYDLPSVPNRQDREAAELTLPADPHQVAAELERRTGEGAP